MFTGGTEVFTVLGQEPWPLVADKVQQLTLMIVFLIRNDVFRQLCQFHLGRCCSIEHMSQSLR